MKFRTAVVFLSACIFILTSFGCDPAKTAEPVRTIRDIRVMADQGGYAVFFEEDQTVKMLYGYRSNRQNYHAVLKTDCPIEKRPYTEIYDEYKDNDYESRAQMTIHIHSLAELEAGSSRVSHGKSTKIEKMHDIE